MMDKITQDNLWGNISKIQTRGQEATRKVSGIEEATYPRGTYNKIGNELKKSMEVRRKVSQICLFRHCINK